MNIVRTRIRHCFECPHVQHMPCMADACPSYYTNLAQCVYNVPYSGLFRGVYISRIANSCSRKVISRMEILNHHASSHIIHYRGLAVLSRNSRNINASKIIHYTVYGIRYQNYTDCSAIYINYHAFMHPK